MKRFAALVLQVVAILAFTGSSLGDDDKSVELHQECPVTMDGGPRMYIKMIGLGLQCLDTSGSDDTLILNYTSLEEHKEFFKNYCGKKNEIRECLADVARTSQSCQNQTHHQTFQVFREQLETTLEAGCVQDGEVLADIVMIYKHNNNTIASNMNVFFECLSRSVEKFVLSFRIPVSDFSRNYILFRDIHLAQKCLNDIEEGDQHIKNGIVNLLNVVVEKYKCFDPQDDSVILCKDLHANHIAGQPKACPIKEDDDPNNSLYKAFLERLALCLVDYSKRETKLSDDLVDLEKSRIFFKHQCDRKPTIIGCLTDTTSLSAPCLDDSHQLMMETVESLLTNTLEHVCAEDGRHLARVATIIFRDVDNSTKSNYLNECKNEALPPSEDLDPYLTSEKTLEYHKKIIQFKSCLINKLQNDDVAVSSAELMLNGVIDNMKCPDPEHTALVLCNTLANNN